MGYSPWFTLILAETRPNISWSSEEYSYSSNGESNYIAEVGNSAVNQLAS